VKVKVVKNKLAPPFTECEFDIMFNEGVSRSGSLLDVALDMKVLEKRGSWISMGDVQIAQGREGAKKAIAEDAELAARLEAAIREKMPEASGPVSEDEPEEMIEDEAVNQ